MVALAAGQRDGEKPRAVGMQELLADPEMMRAMQVKFHATCVLSSTRAVACAGMLPDASAPGHRIRRSCRR